MTVVQWELVPFDFTLDCWIYDPEFGWLMYSPVTPASRQLELVF